MRAWLIAILIAGSATTAFAQSEVEQIKQISERVDYMAHRGTVVNPQITSALVLAFDIMLQLNDQVQAMGQTMMVNDPHKVAWYSITLWKGWIWRTGHFFLIAGLLWLFGYTVVLLIEKVGTTERLKLWMVMAWVCLMIAAWGEFFKPQTHELAVLQVYAPYIWTVNKLSHRVDDLEHKLDPQRTFPNQ